MQPIESRPTQEEVADQIGATPNEVLEWRDEALMLNLASFGSAEHELMMQAGIDGLRDLLHLSLDEVHERLERAAVELNVDMPSDLTIAGWWEQAKTLEEA